MDHNRRNTVNKAKRVEFEGNYQKRQHKIHFKTSTLLSKWRQSGYSKMACKTVAKSPFRDNVGANSNLL